MSRMNINFDFLRPKVENKSHKKVANLRKIDFEISPLSGVKFYNDAKYLIFSKIIFWRFANYF